MSANLAYRLLQGSYWMVFCTGYGYVSFYLLGCGYAAGQIGLITALFGILAAVAQPFLGRLADKGGRWGWKPLLSCLAGAALACALGLLLLGSARSPAVGPVYGLLLFLTSSMMPLVNTASFYYNRAGIPVDFGIARGMGSLSYALLALVLGRVAAAAGVPGIGVAGVAACAFHLAVVLRMPYDISTSAAGPDGSSACGGPAAPGKCSTNHNGDAVTGGAFSFFARYPTFTRMLAASVLLLSFHNITNTYLLQMLQQVGGNSASLGVAMAIAALAELPVMFGFTRIIRRFSAGWLLVVAGVMFAAKGVLFLLAANVAMVYAAELLQMLSFALFASASVYYAEQSMAPADKVTGQAYMSCTITAGAVIGNLIGGGVLDRYGLRAMLWLGLVLAVAGALLALTARPRKQEA